MASSLFGGSVSLQNELLRLLNNSSEHKKIRDATNGKETITADEVIEDTIMLNKNQEDTNPDLSGGRSISAMIDNVMSGGNIMNDKIPPQTTDSSKTLEEIFEFKGGKVMDIDTVDIEEIEENIGTNDSDDSMSSSQSGDDEEDERELPPIEYPNDPENTPLDGDKEFSKRYLRLINEIKQPFEKKNLPLIGGSKTSAKRVKIINAFPYILKSSPTVK